MKRSRLLLSAALLSSALVAAQPLRSPAGFSYQEAERARAQGQVSAAEQAYRAALAADPRFVPAYVGLGKLYGQIGKLQEAEEAFLEALKLDPNNVEALAGLGNVFSLRGEEKEAIRHYRQALQLDPDAVWIRMSLAGLHERRGELPQALEQYRGVLARHPGNPLALLGTGTVLLQQGATEAAVDALTQALARNPALWEARHNRGVAYRRLGRWDLAERDFRAVLEQDPENVPARLELGRVYLHRGEYQRAAEELERLLPRTSGDLTLHHLLTQVYLRLGRREEAIKQREIVEHLRQRAEQIAALEFWVRDNPNDLEKRLELARLYRQSGRLEDALLTYRYVYGRDSRRLEAYDGAARVLLAHGRLLEAVEVYRAAVESNPEAPYPQAMLGVLCRQLGDRAGSEAALRRALELAQRALERSRNPETLEQLAFVYVATGRLEEAEALLQEAIQMDPARETLRQQLEQVRRLRAQQR